MTRRRCTPVPGTRARDPVRPDVALMDLRMPGLDGVGATERRLIER
ncbi:hypothetical protein [Nonomuraea sp. NPDC046570]